MSILVNKNSKVITQGITGKTGAFHTRMCRDYANGRNCFVAGVNPKKAGEDFEGIPIYATVREAKEATGATVSCVFIPAPGVQSAVLEAAEAGMELVVVITEGVPAQDEAYFFNKVKRDFPGTRILGPNCPGIISPGKANIGITAGHIAKAPVEGQPNVGIVSRSGTLTYQALYELKLNDIGVTTCVGIGGDPVPGTSFIDCLQAFEADPDTKAIMMIGEIGGSAEEEAAAFIAEQMTKPVVSYIAGVTAPAGKKMGHAGAIVSGGKGTASAKQEALEAAGVKIGQNPTEAGLLMVEVVSRLYPFRSRLDYVGIELPAGAPGRWVARITAMATIPPTTAATVPPTTTAPPIAWPALPADLQSPRRGAAHRPLLPRGRGRRHHPDCHPLRHHHGPRQWLRRALPAHPACRPGWRKGRLHQPTPRLTPPTEREAAPAWAGAALHQVCVQIRTERSQRRRQRPAEERRRRLPGTSGSHRRRARWRRSPR